MKKIVTIIVLFVWSVAYASTIKTWSNGETVKAVDLNANFTHIHNTMVGNHGARLVNADISATAAIAHTKLATPALLPKAWAYVAPTCDGAAAAGTACTVADSSGVTGIASNGTAGQYRVNLSYSPPNANFGVIVVSLTTNLICYTDTYVATTGDANGTNFLIKCLASGAGAATNAGFTFILMDT